MLYAIDSLSGLASESHKVLVGGWVCGTQQKPEIRARVRDSIFLGLAGLPRPDVAIVHPDSSWSAESGFVVTVSGPPGEQPVSLEVKESGNWVEFYSGCVVFGLANLLASLETPSESSVRMGKIRFSGWCVHPQLAIHSLELRAGNHSFELLHGLDRHDVVEAYPFGINALKSGFEATVQLGPGSYEISLAAIIDNGEELILDKVKQLKISPDPLHGRMISAVHGSKPARLYRFARFGLHKLGTWYQLNRRLPRLSELPRLMKRAYDEYPRFRGNRASSGYVPPERDDPYQAWCKNNYLTHRDIKELSCLVENALERLPTISIVMPVFNPPRQFFEEAIESVRNQVFTGWELCIADDASTDPWVWPRLQELATQDSRIRITRRNVNGNISHASNAAAALATGDFLLFLDQDDLLTRDAVAEVALATLEFTDVHVVYSDDDKIDGEGRRFAPQFKPDWSPELLLSYMYFSHVFCVRRKLFNQCGGFRVGFEGSQDYDLALRVTEKARRVVHLPLVLYHWRVLPGSTALSGNTKPASFEAGRRAVEEALTRRSGCPSSAYRPTWAEQSGLGIFSHRFADEGPRVCVLIPTRNNLRILKRCVDSLKKTSYRNHNIVIIDNNSDDTATLEYLSSLPHDVMSVPNPGGRFNFAYINNRAVEQVDAEFVVFLNDDTEVMDSGWLSQLVGYAQLPGVGAVGARLLYPDMRLQHAGIVHGYYGGLAGPAFKLSPAWDFGYLSYANVARNYSAVTAACLLTSRKLFLEVGGFDEDRFAVAYNDVDYCYRLVDRGYRCVYAPTAELIHHEGASRGFSDNPQELLNFREKYRHRVDPYYSPHLSLDNERFEIDTRRRKIRKTEELGCVLMCAFNLNWEGAPYSQFEMTRELKRRNAICPVVYSPNDGPLRAAYEAEGISVHVFDHPLSGVQTVEEYEEAISTFAKWIVSSGFQVVYGNTLQTFYGIAAAKLAGLPSVWNIRESEPWETYFDYLPPPIATKALQCFEYPYAVVFVSNETRKGFAQLNSANNFCLIHNGLDPARLLESCKGMDRESARKHLGIEPDEVALLLLGTVCARKGQQELVAALGLLDINTTKQIKCFIVGDRKNSYSTQLHRMVLDLPAEVAASTFVIPETEDTAQYYLAADIFICTSRIESYPRVILEAMAFSLPVVSTPCYGIVEQVRVGVNGDFYETGNAKELAAKISGLIQDPARRNLYARNAGVVLKSLTNFDEMVTKYATVFAEAAATKDEGPRSHN
jgi:GT2 family glycosyltransferase